MRCVDVIRELSAPTGSFEDPAVADHLAHCTRCAAWAERDARLGRLLELTRAEEPSAETWEKAWSRIADALDGAPAEVLTIKQPVRSRRALWAFAGIAQIAALVLAVLYFHGHRAAPGTQVAEPSQPVAAGPQPESPPAPVVAEQPIDIPSGELVVIREERGQVEMVELALNGNPGQVDPAYEALNSLEAIAE